MSERATDFSILAEVWEKKENLIQKKMIEEVLEMKGMSYFSTARPLNSNLRGKQGSGSTRSRLNR